MDDCGSHVSSSSDTESNQSGSDEADQTNGQRQERGRG